MFPGVETLDSFDDECQPFHADTPFNWTPYNGCNIFRATPLFGANGCSGGAFSGYTHIRYTCFSITTFSYLQCQNAGFPPSRSLLIERIGLSFSRACTPPGSGACCCNGQCVECHDQSTCQSRGGVWMGVGSRCGEVECRTMGRCCIPGMGCVNAEQGDCLAVGGSWQTGACAQNGEPCTPEDPMVPGVIVPRGEAARFGAPGGCSGCGGDKRRAV